MAAINGEEKLRDFVATCRYDPLRYCQVMFPWGEQSSPLRSSLGLRTWQKEDMETIRDHISDPKTRYTPLLIARSTGHGIGKTADISMIIQWGMSVCPDCKVVVTANTENQLRTKTWPEVAKWFRLALNQHWFTVTATSAYANAEGYEKTWRADAIPWSENNTEAFAGLHNKGRMIILIFDEASSIADKVWEVAEGALTDEDTIIIWIVYGNPTRNIGRFRECFERFKHRWNAKRIDSRTVEGTNKAQLEKWVNDYGEDSDFVRIRVRGEFPRAGSTQFIGSDLIESARRRAAASYLHDPLVIGVDVARFGDDETIIAVRRGRDARSEPWIKMRGADTMQVAACVVDLQNRLQADAIFVDGGGVGGGVVDRLRMLKQPVFEVQFGSTADRAQAVREGDVVYANKRAEMYGFMRDWLSGAMIPDDPDLCSQLMEVQYGYVTRDGKDKIMLEKKADMKRRGLSSPDRADALALTFAYPVQPSDHRAAFENRNGGQHQINYNPLSASRVQGDVAPGHQIEYDPFGGNR